MLRVLMVGRVRRPMEADVCTVAACMYAWMMHRIDMPPVMTSRDCLWLCRGLSHAGAVSWWLALLCVCGRATFAVDLLCAVVCMCICTLQPTPFAGRRFVAECCAPSCSLLLVIHSQESVAYGHRVIVPRRGCFVSFPAPNTRGGGRVCVCLLAPVIYIHVLHPCLLLHMQKRPTNAMPGGPVAKKCFFLHRPAIGEALWCWRTFSFLTHDCQKCVRCSHACGAWFVLGVVIFIACIKERRPLQAPTLSATVEASAGRNKHITARATGACPSAARAA